MRCRGVGTHQCCAAASERWWPVDCAALDNAARSGVTPADISELYNDFLAWLPGKSASAEQVTTARAHTPLSCGEADMPHLPDSLQAFLAQHPIDKHTSPVMDAMSPSSVSVSGSPAGA